MASTVFAPVYPLVARQVIGHTDVTQGTCLDVGCGSGYLGVALAEMTELYIHNGTDHFKNRVRRNLDQASHDRFKDALATAGIESGYVLQNDDIGMWVVMRK